MVESLKPSLDICYNIWNQILYYMQQFRWTFWAFFLHGCLLQTQFNFRNPFEFPYLANQFCLGNFIMFTEILFVDCCVSVRLMGLSVRAWFDALKRDSHTESVRLDRYVTYTRNLHFHCYLLFLFQFHRWGTLSNMPWKWEYWKTFFAMLLYRKYWSFTHFLFTKMAGIIK